MRIADAQSDEQALREERTSALLEEITTLNRERLGLLPYLSSDKRGAVTGFTLPGWDQARGEARHLSLIVRYHQHVARTWLGSLRAGGPSGVSPWSAAAVIVPWLVLVAVFVSGRRRTQALLDSAAVRLDQTDRAERRTSPSPQRRAISLLSKIHRSVEWIAFYACTMWLLPASARNLLEVQLFSSVVGWVLGGALVVNTVNAVAAGTGVADVRQDASGEIRLRSLRLVGRTVVVFALILVLSTRLVGEGTIYSWVFSTCWFAAIPVFLVLVRWWRGTVFERMARSRKKSRLQAWVLANRSGWKSFLAAMIGALQLFAVGALKTARSWLSGFDVARRVHAYLFKREIERIGEGRRTVLLSPLSADTLEVLHPEHAFTRWLSCPADEMLESFSRRLSEGRGGVMVVIGSRGMGKSSTLRAVGSPA